ncbi:MAG: hypothetical protein RDU25_04620 [Patescibacteria group bacterium]|nr:hypothetical protein [Patescibacteria group bacterium]
MNQMLKKVFSTFVSLTTIVWSVGIGTLVMPSMASAATLSAGDLIKASGPAVYYYAADGMRYVFPNEKTYFSWYNDFSAVKTITDSELAAISMGSINVTIRPGTKLVKITTDPKVYAVTKCGTLHWLESEAVAKALYGDAWATRVVDVPDAYFSNYTVGSSVSTNVHPDGSLITYAGDTNKYVVWSGAKRKFSSDAAFAANGYNTLNVITTTISYGNGSDVAGREADLADTVCAGTTPVTGALTVALASDTPAGMTVPYNAASVPLVKVNLTAGSSDVTVTGLRFHRVGVGASADFSNVYLYNQDGVRLTTGRTINSSTNIVEFNALTITVPAGGMKSVYVYGDFSSPASTGGEHSFEVQDAASVVVSGSATVGGSFPVRGNVFVVGSVASARLDVTKGATPANPTIGSKEVEISNFKLTANTNDVSVSQVTLYQGGSITNSDLTNFKLYQGSTLVASAAAVESNGRIVLKFSPAYTIANGNTKVFSLKADVAGRASRTIKTYVEYTTDVTAMDLKYNAGAAVDISTNGTFDGTGTDYIEVTTQGGQLTNSFNGPATGNLSKGQLGAVLYKFALTSPDNTLEIRNLRFTLDDVTGGACKVYGSSGTAYFRNIKIKNLDTGETWMGPKELTADAASTALTFTDSQNIAAGQTINLAFVADLSSSEDTAGDFFSNGNCQYRATFSPFQTNDVRVVDTGEYLDITKIVPNQTVNGNSQTVKSSRLTVSLASNPVSSTLVKKQQNVAVAGLVLSASAESDVTITNLTLAGQAALASVNSFGGSATALANFSQRVTSLALFDGDTQVGLAKAPDTTTGKAQITNMNLTIAKGTSKTLTVKASFSSTASTTAPYDKIAVGVAAAADITAQDADSNTVTPSLDTSVTNQATGAAPSVVQTILNSGTITVQADAHPVSNIVVAGKDAWVSFAQYKATAQYENIEIDRIAILASSTNGMSADSADFVAVAIAKDGAVVGQDTLSSGATSSKDIDLTANKIVVPKDGSVQFQVWTKLSSVQASGSVSGATTGVARSGHAPALGVNTGLQNNDWDSNYVAKMNMRSTGAASGERVYAASGASHGNAMIMRKTMPVVTKQSLSSTTLANIDQDLMKFQVSADSAGSVAWKQATFSFSKSSAVALTNFRLRRGATDLDTGVYAITNATSGADLVSGSLAAGVNSGYVVVSLKPGQEESISGSGNVYTLHATVSGAASGQNVTLSFYRDSTNPLVTGYLVNSTAFGGFASSANVFHIDTAAAPSAAAAATGTFVWSDNSEIPHSSAAQTSRDWTNDLYVTDLSQSQTLSL